MKTLGRILLILAVSTIVMGITYFAVNAGSSSALTNAPAFEGGNGIRLGPDGGQPEFFNGQRPEFARGRRSEFGEGPRGGGWMLGTLRNVGILAVIVTLIGVPKSIWRKRTRTVSASAG